MNRSSLAQSLAGVSALCFVVAGCLAPEEEEGTDETVDDASDELLVSETLVDLDQGGIVVDVRIETQAEQRVRLARIEELRKQGLGSSSDAISEVTCLGGELGASQLQIWSNDNYTGSQICFTGEGVADLNFYCRFYNPFPPFACADTWADSVRSFKTGSYGARFGDATYSSNILCCQTACAIHGQNEDVSEASACEETRSLVDRGSSVSCTTCVE